MGGRIDTICHADRVRHEVFGDIDLLILYHDGECVREGSVGWILRPDNSRIQFRVRGFWHDQRTDDPRALAIVVAPLPVHPSGLEGCAIEWDRVD